MRRLSGFAVFDLDGTLVDTLDEIRAALNRVLARHQRRDLSRDEVQNLIGHGPYTLLERAWKATGMKISPSESIDLAEEYSREYDKNPPGTSRPYPGVVEGLRRLVRLGWKLGICTNKHGGAARSLVRELGWERWIRVVVSGEETYRKPDPRVLQLSFQQLGAGFGRHLFIGDSQVDLQTAQNARIEGIFLSHGYGEMGSFRSARFESAVNLFRWMAQSGPQFKSMGYEGEDL